MEEDEGTQSKDLQKGSKLECRRSRELLVLSVSYFIFMFVLQ